MMNRVVALISIFLFGCTSAGPVVDDYTRDEQHRLESWAVTATQFSQRHLIDSAEKRELKREASDDLLEPGERASALRRLGFNVHGRQEGKWQRAASLLEVALALAPEDPKVLEDAGRAFVLVGDRERGIELLQRADTQVAAAFLELLDR